MRVENYHEEKPMRAFAAPEFNGTGSIVERPRPEPGPGEILVRVEAAGVNPIDPGIMAGYMAGMFEHRKPLIPGMEYAGEVAAVGGGVENVAVGDRVFGGVGKMIFGEGTWVEYATVNAALANRIPEGLDATTAAGIPLAGGTALALVDAVDAGPGKTILVIGAAGGVGSFAVQLAARAGATVIAATRPANTEYVRSLGADDVVESSGDIVAQVRRHHPDGVDAIIDTYHDAEGLRSVAPIVKRNGWLVSPRAQGAPELFADEPISVAVVSAALGRVGELGELAARGELSVNVKALPLAEGGRALAAIASAGVRGKLVLTIS